MIGPMSAKNFEHLKRRVRKRQANFGEVDRLITDCDYWRQKAAEYHFLLDQIWKDDPILREGPDTLPPQEAIHA